MVYVIKKVYFIAVFREDTKQKTTFFYKWRKFTGKLHNENIIL